MKENLEKSSAIPPTTEAVGFLAGWNRENGRTHKEFKINKEKVSDNIVEMAIASNKTGHPAVFPDELAQFHIKSWSNEGDVVFDPFMGSGTVAKAAKELNRNYIGFEIVPEYVEICKNRLK